MESSLTISQLDSATADWIEQEAQRTGHSIEAVVRHLITRGIEVERQQEQHQRHHDLDALAGTWSDEEAEEFFQSVADFSEIDSSLWQ